MKGISTIKFQPFQNKYRSEKQQGSSVRFLIGIFRTRLKGLWFKMKFPFDLGTFEFLVFFLFWSRSWLNLHNETQLCLQDKGCISRSFDESTLVEHSSKEFSKVAMYLLFLASLIILSSREANCHPFARRCFVLTKPVRTFMSFEESFKHVK